MTGACNVKYFKITILFVCIAVLLLAGLAGCAAEDDKTLNHERTKTFTQKELKADLRQAEKYILQDNPLYFADKARVEQLFSAADAAIEDGMNEEEFYRLLNPVISAVHCGHTNLSISQRLWAERQEQARFFPLKVTLVGDKLYSVENDRISGLAAGDEIKAINGLPSGEIIARLLSNISGDGDYESKRRYIISRHFNSRYYDFVDSSDEFEVHYVNAAGMAKTAHLQAKYREDFLTTAWDLHFLGYEDGNYYDYRIVDDYALLTVRVFMNEKGNKFGPFLDRFFAEVRHKNISKLIIDLRGNYGGDSFMAKELLSYLTTTEFSYFAGDLPLLYDLLGFTKPVKPKDCPFGGDVVVLTDGACFSTTAHLCALLKYHGLATLVGGETGGSFVCTDSARDAVLEHTQLRLHYATQIFEVNVDEIPGNSGIKPDITVESTIGDILNGTDTVMETALKTLQPI